MHCCSYNSHHGKCYHANWSDGDEDGEGGDWDGREPLDIGEIDNVKVGLLLDLNSGFLSLFKDGRLLGVMKEGLTGAYCWYVCGVEEVTCEVKIERGMPPGEEEVWRPATS